MSQYGNAAPSPSGAILAVVGGGLSLLGSLLSWAQVTIFIGTVGVAGTEGDGKITLATGLVLGIGGVLQLTNSRAGRPLAAVGAILTLLVAAIDLVTLSSRIGELASDFAQVSVGVGLWMVLVGGVLGLVGVFIGQPALARVRMRPDAVLKDPQTEIGSQSTPGGKPTVLSGQIP